MSEKLKTPLKIGAAAAFLLLCIFLPRAFSSRSDPRPIEIVSPVEFSQRAELFTNFWEWEGNANKLDLEYSAIDEADLAECERLRDELLANLDIDKEKSVFSVQGGKRVNTLSDGAGNGMNLIDYFYQWEGDWTNWLTITMDIETQDVYRIYFSTRCIKNFERYIDYAMMVGPSGDSEIAFGSGPMLADEVAGIFGHCTQLTQMGKQVLDNNEIEKRIYTFADEDNNIFTYGVEGSTYFHPEQNIILVDFTLRCQSDA